MLSKERRADVEVSALRVQALAFHDLSHMGHTKGVGGEVLQKFCGRE